MTAARRGPLIGATWLIGLGLVFLIQRWNEWTWTEAWPLFVILAGVASGVSALLDGVGGRAAPWRLTWPIAWIVIGVLLLASTTGSLGVGPGDFIAEWWPWALVILGVWFVIGAFLAGGRSEETLTVPLDGAQHAQVRIKFGGGELTTHKAAPGMLVDGTFRGGVRRRREGPGRVELRPDGDASWLGTDTRWDVGLTAEVPLDLRLEVGAYRGTVDLSELRLSSLDLHTGASETRIRLPKGAGLTSVTAEAGAAALTIEVPSGVAARIRTRMALGSSQVDTAHFPQAGDVYQSIDYATATDRVDIDIRGGVGSVRVIGGA